MEAPSLTPQVHGRLSQQELAIIELIKAGSVETFRTSISLDPTVALAAMRAADEEKRDFSNYVTVALLDRCGQRSGPAPVVAEFMAKVQAAAADPQETKRIITALEKALRQQLRPAKAA